MLKRIAKNTAAMLEALSRCPDVAPLYGHPSIHQARHAQ